MSTSRPDTQALPASAEVLRCPAVHNGPWPGARCRLPRGHTDRLHRVYVVLPGTEDVARLLTWL